MANPMRKVLADRTVADNDGRRTYLRRAHALDCGHYSLTFRKGSTQFRCWSCGEAPRRRQMADEYEAKGEIKIAERIRREADKIEAPDFSVGRQGLGNG